MKGEEDAWIASVMSPETTTGPGQQSWIEVVDGGDESRQYHIQVQHCALVQVSAQERPQSHPQRDRMVELCVGRRPSKNPCNNNVTVTQMRVLLLLLCTALIPAIADPEFSGRFFSPRNSQQHILYIGTTRENVNYSVCDQMLFATTRLPRIFSDADV